MSDRRRLQRWMTVVAVTVLVAVAVGMGVLTVMRVRGANAEVDRLSTRNVARLTVMGEIRGRQARINDGAANLFSPGRSAAQRAETRRAMRQASADMHRLMVEYQGLVRGSAAEHAFTRLMRTWRAFRNGLGVYLLHEPPIPGEPLPAGPERLGEMTVSITDGLDAQAELEQAGAATAAERQQAASAETIREIIGVLAAGLLFAGGVAVVAVRTDTARRRTEVRFRALVQSSSDVISILDADGRAGFVSPSVQPIMGFTPESLMGVDYRELIHPDDVDRAERLGRPIRAAGGREHRIELRVRHADGTWHWHEVVARNLLDDPAVRGVVVNHWDISERREFQDRLAHDATHDALTGLANRAVFLADVGRALIRSNDGGHACAVLFVDLNGFKQINDTWGHMAGDALLSGVARLLERSVLGADTVARLGGDEFGVCLSQIDAPENAEAVARRICTGLAEPFDAAGHTVHARASIGIAVSGPGCRDADEMLRRADIAMYEVKRRPTGGWRTFTTELEAGHAAAGPTADELQKAIAGGRLRLHYQPIIALDTGRVHGVEALVRWDHPALGLLAPSSFVPVAEAGGLIAPLGDWVLENACAQVRDWWARSGPGRRITLSVNLSPRQLDDPGLVERVLTILGHTGFDPRDLILEITEEALVNDDAAVEVLERLQAHGIRLALDDFGTGYSSLRYLTRLPVDVLKLDRCFVAELDGSAEGSAVAEAVSRLSRSLALDTIAEGVETAAQAAELSLLGYRLAQGFHFARPMEPAAIEDFLELRIRPPAPS